MAIRQQNLSALLSRAGDESTPSPKWQADEYVLSFDIDFAALNEDQQAVFWGLVDGSRCTDLAKEREVSVREIRRCRDIVLEEMHVSNVSQLAYRAGKAAAFRTFGRYA